jgi:hypothetical protein
VPPGGSEVSLSAVSCSSVTTCVAVGEYSPAGGGAHPLAEVLEDEAWTATVLPLPSRAYFTSLSPVPLLGGVSCVGAGSCVAVGEYAVHRGRSLACCYRYFPLVETLAGTSWSAATGPTPPGSSDGSLSGVSCTAASCVAVGNADTAGGTIPLAETLKGRRWRAASLPLPAGGSEPAPFPWTVSCVDSGCVALGAYLPEGAPGGLVAESLSGDLWTPTALPLPDGGSYGFPGTYEPDGGLSCVASGSCVAVSPYQSGDGSQGGLAEALSGGVWTASGLPAPAGGSLPFPQDVSCAEPQSCVAVGSYPAGGGGESPLAEVLSGSGWTAGALALPAALPDGSLTALSCPSSSSCVAVGDSYDEANVQTPFAETLSGSSWEFGMIPLPAGSTPGGDADPLMDGLSCTSAVSCVAVGYDPGPGLAEHPLVEILSGKTWKPQRVPLPPGVHGQSASLSGVSCVSATSCVAVGALRSEDDALIETLTGSTWVASALAPPDHEPRVWLSSVSCPSAGSCVAIGAFWGDNPGYSRPLAARLSGGVWHTTRLSLPAGARDNVAFTVPLLRSVWCASAGSCLAVGFYPTGYDTTAPLAENLSGTRWHPVAPATDGGGNWTLLWGLSCVSITSCTAVGEDDGVPLVESLSGTGWTPDPIALPMGNSGASLQAVSCWATGSCRAVGGGIGLSGVYPVVATDTG